MKKFLLYILKVFLIGLVLAYVIAEFSFWSLRRGNFYKPSFVENSIKEKEIDYIILGASTALTGIDTKLLDSLTGLNGFNLAIDDTGLPNHYLMLAHFLETGHRTKKVILAPTLSSLKETSGTLGDNDYRFLMYNKRDYTYNYYDELENGDRFPVLSSTKYFPFLGISYYNVELFFPSLVSALKPKKHNRFDEVGDYTYPNRKFKSSQEFETKDIDFKNDYFQRILATCQSKGIELLIYFPPIYNTEIYWESSSLEILNLTNYLKETKYFYDEIHVNKIGKTEATKIIAENIYL